jgi:hypothetical protein
LDTDAVHEHSDTNNRRKKRSKTVASMELRPLKQEQSYSSSSSGSKSSLQGEEPRSFVKSLELESFAWKSLRDHKNRPYYFSVLTGETVWDKPKAYVSRRKREGPSVVHDARQELADIARVCDACGVEFEVVMPGEAVNDAVYGNKIRGTAPKLGSCLFYQPLLVAGLQLYPPAFVKKSGLRKIVLCGDLHYLTQARKAIPVEDTGTLYLDPDPEIIYYLQDVLHHEFFHIIDSTGSVVFLLYFADAFLLYGVNTSPATLK